ncbi:hypothetical protein AeRB84_002503 [Aphanomyces euteiches]|nr:hypothetical protein AeRB84_002503 [Aphanomyces euteiches]
MDALLALVEELYLLNKRFPLERIQRVWEMYRKWLNPHMMDGGYSLTSSEFFYIVEFKTEAEQVEAERLFDRMKVFTPTNGRFQMDLLEFLLTFTVLSRGTWENKCQFVFHLMDFDIEDEIAEEELAMVITLVCDGLQKLKVLQRVPTFQEVNAMAADGFCMNGISYGSKMNFNQFLNWCVFHADPLSLLDYISCGLRARTIIHKLNALVQKKKHLLIDPYYTYQLALQCNVQDLESVRVVCGPVVGQVTSNEVRVLYEFNDSVHVKFFAFRSDDKSELPIDILNEQMVLEESIEVRTEAYIPQVVHFKALSPQTSYLLCFVGSASSDCIKYVVKVTTLPENCENVSLHLLNHEGHSILVESEEYSYYDAFFKTLSAPNCLNVHCNFGAITPSTILNALKLLRKEGVKDIQEEFVRSRVSSHFRGTFGHRLVCGVFSSASNYFYITWHHVMYGLFTEDDFAALGELNAPLLVQWMEGLVQDLFVNYVGKLWPQETNNCLSFGKIQILFIWSSMQSDVAAYLECDSDIAVNIVITAQPVVTYEPSALPSVLEPLMAWRLRSASFKLIFASVTSPTSSGFLSTITLQDTTTSFLQIVCGSIKPTLAYKKASKVDPLPSYRLERYIVQHTHICESPHVGIVNVEARMARDRSWVTKIFNQLIETRPSDSIQAVIGPVVGLVTSSEASILIECDREALLICHVIDRITRSVITCRQTTKSYRPVVIQIDNLQPRRRYDVQIQGLEHLAVSFHTRQRNAPALHLTCVGDDNLFPTKPFAPPSSCWPEYTTNIIPQPCTDITVFFGRHLSTSDMTEQAMHIWQSEPDNLEKISDCFRKAFRVHWMENQHVLAQGSHCFALSRRVVECAQQVAWEYQQYAQTGANGLRRYNYHDMGNVGFLHLDVLENRLHTSHEYLHNTPELLSQDQWELIEMVLTKPSDTHVLIITCDIPIVWQLDPSFIPVSRLWRDWIMYPNELTKLLSLSSSWKHAEERRNILLLCGGPIGMTTRIKVDETVELQQIVVGPISNPENISHPVPASGILFDRFSVQHIQDTEGQPQYVSVSVVPHPKKASIQIHRTQMSQPSAKILLGPVVGKLTATSVRILIEVDRDVEACTCVCTNTGTQESHEITLPLPVRIPKVFPLADLKPNCEYSITFKGITPLEQVTAFRTPHIAPFAFDVIVIHDSNWHNLSQPNSPWEDILKSSSYHALDASATATENGDDLTRPDNLWSYIHDTSTSLPLCRPLMIIHNGAQAHSKHAFSDKELVTMVHRLLDMPSEEWVNLRPEIQHRLQEIYRVQWGISPFRDALRVCGNFMLFDEDDLYFAASLVESKFDDKLDVVAQILQFFREIAQTVWFYYQNQLWIDLNEDILTSHTSNFVQYGQCTFVLLNKTLNHVAISPVEQQKKLTKRNSTKTAGIDLTKVAQANNLLPPASWLVLDDALIAAKTDTKLLSIVLCVDLLEASMASLYLIGVTRLMEKVFDWKNQNLYERQVCILMQSSTTNDIYNVTDQRSHATIQLIPCGSVTNAKRYTEPSYPPAGHFSKRFTFARQAGAQGATEWARSYRHFHFTSDLDTVEWYQIEQRLPDLGYCCAILGPILGRMSLQSNEETLDYFVTVNILLEVNSKAKITCVLTDIMSNTEIRVSQDVEANVPVSFVCTPLRPSSRYSYSFEGLANREDRKGVFHTPSKQLNALNIVAVSTNFPQERLVGEPNLWEALYDRLLVPWHGIDIVLHLGGQAPMQEVANDCLRWLQSQPKDGNSSRWSQLIRTRFQQAYRQVWNTPFLRTVLSHTSQSMIWSGSDIASFFGRPAAALIKDGATNADMADMQLITNAAKDAARMYFNALGWRRNDKEKLEQIEDDPPGEGSETTAEGQQQPTTAVVDYYSIRMDLLAVFVFDMRSTDEGDQISCNGRLASPPTERPLISEAQWLAFEGVCRKKRVRVLVLVMEFPLFLSSKAESFDGRGSSLYNTTRLEAHWLSCPAQLDQLVSLLFRWKEKIDGRDVVILSGNLWFGLDTFIQDAKSSFGLHNYVTGPITGPVRKFPYEDEGSILDKKFSFVHRFPPPQANYVLLEISIIEEQLPDESLAHSAFINGELVHADNMRVMHDPKRLNRWPSWWRNYCPMAPTAFWSDIVLKSQPTEVNRIIREETGITNMLKPLYEKYNFVDTTRMEELQSTTLSPKGDEGIKRFERVLGDVWGMLTPALKKICANVQDRFVLDIAMKTLQQDLNGPIDMATFQAVCKEILTNAALIHVAMTLHDEDEADELSKKQQEALREMELERRRKIAEEQRAKQEDEHLAELQKRSILEYAQEKNRLEKEKADKAAADREAAKAAKKAARDAEKEKQREEDLSIRKEKSALKQMKQTLDEQTAARGGEQTDESRDKEMEWTRRTHMLQARIQRREEQKYREGVRKEAKQAKKKDK